MSQNIDHIGIIKGINGNVLLVSINQQSSCSSCSSKSSCFSSGKNEMVVEVVSDKASDYNIGDTVRLCASGKIGFIAVFYAYFLPLLLLVIVLFGSIKMFNMGEMLSILLSFVSLAAYYLILYFFRGKLKSKINFELK